MNPTLRAVARRARAVISAPAGRPALLLELAVIGFLLVVYDRITALVGVKVPEAVERAREILRLEAGLHLDVERGLNLALAGHHDLSRAASVYYDFAHATVTVSVLALLYLVRPDRYRRARRALVSVNLAALAVFFADPVAPPRLLHGAGFVDVVADSHTWGSWEGSTSAARHADIYAATPSLHVAWATWVLLAVASVTTSRVLRALACGHLLLTTTIVVATGNHYLLDVASGAMLSAVAWAVMAPRCEVVEPTDRARASRDPASTLAERSG